MAEYLLPNKNLTIEEQRTIFSIRNRMADIPANFSSKKENTAKCTCGESEDMKHVYNCKYLNIEEPTEEYLKILEKREQCYRDLNRTLIYEKRKKKNLPT